ncbi:MAG: sigma-70 family RNA polymerase sigma factor [Planctomycetes bacterium]|nr:sigma-70 family RNA polymerase sigma factor [Planctomycetota bacterium]
MSAPVPESSDSIAGAPAEAHASDPADARLLARLADESASGADRHAALEELVERWEGKLYAFVRSILQDAPGSEDVVQDTFVVLWTSVARKHREITNLKSWLFKVASRKAMNAIRSRRSKPDMLGDSLEALEAPAPQAREADVERREIKEALYNMVNGLPDALRLPVLLHYGSGFTQVEIAEMIGCRQTTVSERLKRALEKLRSNLGRVGYGSMPAALPLLLQDTFAAPPASLLPQTGVVKLAQLGERLSRRLATAGAGSAKSVFAVAGLLAAGAAATGAALFWPGNVPTDAPAQAATAASAGESTPDGYKLWWRFDKRLPAELATLTSYELFYDQYDTYSRREARVSWDAATDGVRWTPDGKSAGALVLDKCRGVVLPVALDDAPLEIAFERGFFRQFAGGLVEWPSKQTRAPLQNRQFNVTSRTEPPKRPEDWLRSRIFTWAENGKRLIVYYVDKELNGVSVHGPHEGKELRLYLAGISLALDDLRVRPAEEADVAKARADAEAALARKSEREGASLAPPWQPIAASDYLVPGVPSGTWKAEQTAAGAVFTFQPNGGKLQELATYLYFGKNRTESFEARGVVEYTGTGDRLPFHVGVVQPNRFNFLGTYWNLTVRPLPVLFHIQVWIDEKGVRATSRVWNMEEMLGNVPADDNWIDEPWKNGTTTGRPGWCKFRAMKNAGFGVAAHDFLRVRNVEVRPLLKEDLLFPVDE